MNIICIIPSRLGSTRLPGKPLISINGIPLLGHCFYRACLAFGKENVFVATCDSSIESYIQSLGGKVIRTSSKHIRASTRTEEAFNIISQTLLIEPDLIVMYQGDEPLIKPSSLKRFHDVEIKQSLQVFNLVSPFTDKHAFFDKNNVKVVHDIDYNALYFSREPIPSSWQQDSIALSLNQVGVIAFTPAALSMFNSLSETSYEILESVDMNRLVQNRIPINLLPIDYIVVGVDTQQDLHLASSILKTDLTYQTYSGNCS